MTVTVQDGATLLVDGSGSDDFGTTTIGTPVQKTFTIYNSDVNSVDLYGISQLPEGFSVVNTFPASVPANGSTTFTIQMDASSMESPNGQLSFYDDEGGYGSYSFNISGAVNQPPPAITVKDGSTLLDNGSGSDDFGSTTMGTPVQKTFTVYNSSANIVHLSGEPSLPEGFRVVEPYPTSVPANGSTTFTIQMDASSAGFPNGQLMFSEDDPGGYGYYSFNISGMVNEPPPTSLVVWDGTTQIANDPSGSGTPTDSFGSTTAGTPMQKTFTIQNTGSTDITLSSGSLHLPLGFRLVGSLPTTVPAGSNNTTLTIQMDATAVSNPSGELWFNDDDPGGTKYEFEIGGSVTAPPVPAIHLSVDSQALANGGSYSFPDGTVSATDTKTFQIQNTGGAALSISSITLPAGFSLQGSAPSSIAAGQAATFTVNVATSVAGSFTGAMTINDNDPNNASFIVNVSGLVVMPGVTIQATTPVADEQLSTTGRFTVTRSGPTTSPLMVDYTVSGTALAGTDYVALSGNVTIPAGAASATIDVAPPHGGLTNEIQQITLPAATGGTYTLAVGDETTTALAFDASAAVVRAALAALASVGAGRVSVTGSGASSDPFVVTFSGPLGGRLPQIVGDGSQLTGGGSTTIATTISQAGGFGGTVQVSLTADTDYTLGSPSQDTVTVLDAAPVVTVVATQPQADEVAGTSGVFTLNRNGPTADPLTADYWFAGSALDGVDYQWVPGSVTFAPGQSSVTVAIAPLDNGLPGADKSAQLTLAPSSAGQGQGGYSLAGATTDTVTIVNNNLTTVNVVANVPRADAKSGKHGSFTVTRVGKTDADLIVDYSVGGTASAGSDYLTLSGAITIPAGQASATIDVTPLVNSQALATSTADVLLSTSANYVVGSLASAEVTILDDNLPQVSVNASTPLAFEQAGSPGVFTISIGTAQSHDLTVHYTTSGTAIAGTDYQALSGQATIPAGETSVTISVAPLNDPAEYGATTVGLSLSADPAYKLATAKTAIVSIIGDMSLPTVTLVASTPVADENSGTNGQFTVARSGLTSNALTVYYTIAGSAANGTDYQTLSGNVTIPAGQASATITISPLADPAMAGGSRAVQLTLTNYGGPSAASYTIGNPASGTVTVSDLPLVSIQATTPTADENTGAAGQFTVTRVGDTSHDLTVAYAVGGTAATSDFQHLSGTVTIPAGQSSATLAISPLDVHRVGGSETVQLTLAESPAYTIGAATTDAVTILDDDPPAITITATTSKASERTGAAGVFAVTRTGPTDNPLIVPYNVAGTAISGTDYQALSGSVTIPAGQTSATIPVTPNDIGLAGGSSTVQLTLSGGSGYVVASPGNDTVTIEDDDLPVVTLAVAQANATESGTAGSYTVTRAGATSQPLIVLYTIGGDAINGTDYQKLSGNVTIPAGQSSATIAVTPINDPLVFADQTVQLALAGASDYAVGSQHAGMVTIFDDNPPTVSIAATTPTADEETASAGRFTVTRLGAPDNPLTVNYTIGGTAVAGTDYSALSGSVTIPAGESSATIDVTPIDDGGVAEVQQVIVPTAMGGSFKLSVDSQTTTALPYNATAAQVQTALAALVNIGPGNVTVSGLGTAANPFLVTFCGALMDVNVPQIVGDGSLLTGTASINVSTTTQGKGGANEVQLVGYTLSGSDNGGSISFTVNGQTTYPVYCTANAATVQSALEYVLGTGNVSVVAVDTGPSRYTWQITFQGSLASQDLPQSTTNVSAIYLTSGSTATPADSTIANGGTSGAADEVQQVVITGAVGGTFTLSYGGQTTAPLAYNATASDVQSGLHLSSLGESGVSVSGPAGGPWVITFQGTLADQDVPQITADGSGLIGTTQITTSISTPADHDKTVVATLSSSSGYVLGSATSDTVTIAENDNHAPTALTIQYTAPTGAEFSRAAESGVLYGATDPEGSLLSAVLLEGVSHGTLTLNADGSFDYTPDNGYVGTDSFVFQAFDGVYYSLPSVVTFNIVPPPAPVLAVLDSSGNSIANSTGSDSLGDTVVGAPLSTTVTIKNTGTAALTLDPASLVVPSGFTVITPFASTVAPGASTTLVIQLDAASAGQYTGAVQFTDNDSVNGAFQFTISGTVNVPAPQIAVSAGNMGLTNGGSFTLPTRGVGEPLLQTFTITNRGSADLALDAGSISLPSGYSLVTPFANTVSPGNSTTLVVELTAQAAGEYDGNLQFTDNDAGNSTFVVALVGSVIVSPVLAVYDSTTPVVNSGSVTLGTALVGTPLTKTLTIANAGSADLTLDPNQVTLPAGYTVMTAFATTVAPGASTSITLKIDGSTAGDFQGTVSFPTNDPAAGTFSFQVEGLVETPEPQMVLYDGLTQIDATTGTVDFGTNQLDTSVDKTLTIKNVGTADLVLPHVMVLPSGYRMVSLDSTDIAPGGSASLVIEMIGGFQGAYSGTASIHTNDTANSPFKFNVTGSVAAPQLHVTLDSVDMPDISGRVDFGNGEVGTPTVETFTVTNAGDGTLTLTDPIIVSPGFSVASDFGATTLAPGESTTFAVQLDNQTVGSHRGLLVFATNDPNHLIYDIGLRGETGMPTMQVGVNPQAIPVDGSNFDFGNAPLGSPVTKTFTITNAGSGELILSDPIHLPDGFSLVSDFGQTELAPGESTTFAVELSAVASGFYSGDISFGNNAALSGAFRFPVSGGVGIGRLQVLEGAADVTNAANPVEFGMTVPNQPITETFTVVNTGSGDLTLSDPIGLPAGYSLATDFAATTLAPGDSTSFQVELMAAAGGSFSGAITFGTNLANQPSYSLPIDGEVVDLSNFRLWNDTGYSSTDGVTSDPTVAGNLSGLPSGTTVEVQFDENGDGAADESMQAGGDTPFAFTPKDLVPGPISIAARVHLVNLALGGDLYTDWSPLSFTLETGTNAKPVVANLALQSVTVPGASTPTSSDSTMTGLVYNDGNAGYMTIQVDANGDGQEDDVTTTDSSGQFVYAPQKLSPGTYTYHFRAIENDYPNGQIIGDWTPFTFIVVAPNAPVVDQLSLANATGPGTSTTTDPTLTGHITADGNPQQVEVDFDYNGDGVVDASTFANSDGSFTYTPIGLQPGSQTIHVRAVNADDNIKGGWTSITFTLAVATAPTVSTLGLAHDTGSSATDNISDDPTVTGTLSGGVGIANITVQFDVNGDGVPDGSATSDADGNFTFLPLGLQPGSVTISARAVATDPVSGALLIGDWKSLFFTLSTTAAPSVIGLTLEHPSGTDSQTGEPTATDATLTGSLTDGGLLTSFMTVEYDINGDGKADGSTMTDARGDFTFTPQGLLLGGVTVAVRGVARDPQTGAEVDGAWTSISFVLQQDAINQIPTPPGGGDAQTTGDQVAATSLQASQQAVNDALRAFNAAMGYGSTPDGQVALGIGTYTALSGMAGGRVESGSIYDAENGSLPAPAGVGGSIGGSGGTGVTGPSLPGSTPLGLASGTPLSLSNLATPQATSGSITGQAVNGSTTLGPGTDTVTGTLSGSWSVVVTPDSQDPNVTDWVIDVQITAPYDSLLGGTYTDTAGTASIDHAYADDVGGTYTFTFHAAGTTTSTPAGNIVAGTYTVGEKNDYDFNYNDTPIKTDPTEDARSASANNMGSSGSHSFLHEETGGSFSGGAGTGSVWEGQPNANGGPTISSDFINVESETSSAIDGGSGSHSNGSARGSNEGGNTENSAFGYNRNHFEAGNYQLLPGGGTSADVSFHDDQQQNYDASDSETEDFLFGTEDGEVNGTLNSSDVVHDVINEDESGDWTNGPGGYQLNVTSFDDHESDSESFRFSEAGNESENTDGISIGGSFSLNAADDASDAGEQDGSYDVNGTNLSISGASFSGTAHADDTLAFRDGGSYEGTQNDDGDDITLSGSYGDSASENDSVDKQDDGTYNVDNQDTTDSGEDTVDETAGQSYSSGGSDGLHDASINYSDTYSDAGGGGESFHEAGTFSDDSAGETADGADSDHASASDLATASQTINGSDGLSTITGSDSVSDSSSFTYHDDGNYDITPAIDHFTGDEGETDTETESETWNEGGSKTGSNSFQFSEGGGSSVNATHSESDHYTFDDGSTNSHDEEQGTFSDNDGGTASATYSDSGTSSNASMTVNYDDSQSASDSNSYTDSDNFDNTQTNGAESDSQSMSFSASDDNAFSSTNGESGTYTDASDAGEFSESSTSDSEHIETDNGNKGNSNSGTTNFSVSDSSHTTFGDAGSGHFTNGQTGNYSDRVNDDDTETSSESGSTVTTSTGTVTSGTFGDDSHNIRSDYADEEEQQSSSSKDGDKLDFDNSSYHENGNFINSNLTASRAATYTANDLLVAINDFHESLTAAHEADGEDDATLTTDSSNGNYTSASGTISGTATGTVDKREKANDYDSQQSNVTGPDGAISTSQSHSASLGDHSHETGSESEVNGAVTAADEDYSDDGDNMTDDSILTSGPIALPGQSGNFFNFAEVSVTARSNDGGTHSVTGGATIDSGDDIKLSYEVDRGSDSIAELLNNAAGVGIYTQVDAVQDINRYYDSADYTLTNGVDVESDDVYDHDTVSAWTSQSESAHAEGDPATNWISSSGISRFSDDVTNENFDESAGAITSETDYFDDEEIDDLVSWTHSESPSPVGEAAPTGVNSMPDDFPQLLHPKSAWETAPEWMGGEFTPPAYAGGVSSGSSTVDEFFTDYNDDHAIGMKTDDAGATNVDEIFFHDDAISDSRTETDTLSGSYAASSGNGTFSLFTQTSETDSQNDTDSGTSFDGVTWEDYDDQTSQSESVTSSYTSDVTAIANGITQHGHKLEFSAGEKTVSLVADGSYTMDQPGDNEDHLHPKQTLVVDVEITEGLDSYLEGDEIGPQISLSGRATFLDSAATGMMSSSGEFDDEDGATTHLGSYNGGHGEAVLSDFLETGSITNGYMIQQIFYWNTSQEGDSTNHHGPYSDPAVPDTVTKEGDTWASTVETIKMSVDPSQMGNATPPYETDWDYSNSVENPATVTQGTNPGDGPQDNYVGDPPPGSPADIAKKAEEAGMTVDEFLAFNDAEVAKNRANATPESVGWETIKGAASGVKTGAKAVVNGTAKAVVSTATLGFAEGGHLLTVTDQDRANGYDQAEAIAKASGEIIIGATTGTLATKMACGGRVMRAGSIALRTLDSAQNVVDVGRAGIDMAENGLTLQNTMQLGGGLLGTVGDLNGLTKRGCFTAGTLVLTPARDEGQATSTPAVLATAARAIESISLGSRVLGENPREWEVDTELPEPDSASWVRITAEVRHSDGAVVEMEFLRPQSWVAAPRISAGTRLVLNLPELRVYGEATIGSVSPSPPIESGEGHVVTGRFVTRNVSNLVRLSLSDGTTIEVTSVHLIWSADRQEWTPAGQLRAGELLDGAFGTVTVEQVDVVGFSQSVFNIEVHGQHVYRVAEPGVLVHNTYAGVPNTPNTKLQQWAQQGEYIDPQRNTWKKFDGTLAADHVYPKQLIKKMDGFDKLTHQQQDFLLNYPGNFQPLPTAWNSSKKNKLADAWAKTPMGSKASKEYVDALRERQQAFEAFAKELISFWLS